MEILYLTPHKLAWEGIMEVLTASILEHVLNLGTASFHISVSAASAAKRD